MDAICYVCNTESSDWRRNFTAIKSQHTQTPISQFIRKFLGDFQSSRHIDSESNCICVECLQKIDDYDWTCQQAVEQEVKIRDLLWTTEANLIDSGNDEHEIGSDQGEMSPESDVSAVKTVVKPIRLVYKSSLPKAMVVGQNEKSLTIRPMNRNTNAKPNGPSSLQDLPVGTLLRTKDGKMFRIKSKGLPITTTATTTQNTPSHLNKLREKTEVPNSIAPNLASSTEVPAEVPSKNWKWTIRKKCDVCGESFTSLKLLAVSFVVFELALSKNLISVHIHFLSKASHADSWKDMRNM